jgi:hypothetical protein
MPWQIKLERAKRHYAELGAIIANFFATQPYKVSTRRKKDGRLVYYLSEVADMPNDIPCVIGDVIQNLRTALDHLAYSLWLDESNDEGRGERVYFPIDKDAESYNRNKSGKTQGISAQSMAIIDSLQPYRGGNDALWRIHSLNNRDKHRLLVTVGSSFQSFDLGAYMLPTMRRMMEQLAEETGTNPSDLPGTSLFLKPADNLFPLKADEELFIGTKEDVENPRMQFRFSILLHESGVVEGETVDEVLTAMIAEVERIGLLF